MTRSRYISRVFSFKTHIIFLNLAILAEKTALSAKKWHYWRKSPAYMPNPSRFSNLTVIFPLREKDPLRFIPELVTPVIKEINVTSLQLYLTSVRQNHC